MSAEVALRSALFALWRDDSAVGAFVADRIYDRVPERATFPYVEFGETQSIDRDAICHARFEIYQTVHVWSRTVGQAEAMNIIHALRASARAAWFAKSLAPAGYTVAIIQHESTRVMDDPDGLTTHGVVTFQTVVDPH